MPPNLVLRIQPGGNIGPRRGMLRPYHQVIMGAIGKPLPIARQMWYLRLKWGSATGLASFVVISGLAGTPALIGMDLTVPLWVQINAA